MSGLARRLMGAGGAAEKPYVDDVFSTWLYTGNGSTQTINNGIDLAGKGGLIWAKSRTNTEWHHLVCTGRGNTNALNSNDSGVGFTASTYITSFNSNGFALGSSSGMNGSGQSLASWTFRNADKFYGHQVVTKSAGSNSAVSFANLGALGMVRVKSTDITGSWYVWHRSLSAGQLLVGETTAAAATLGHVTVSGTTVTLVNGVIADGTYLVEAFAHDSSADGIIQCGIFTTDVSGNATVNLGWEPQWLLNKTPGSVQDWWISDISRSLTVSASAILKPNTSSIEQATGNNGVFANGFIASASPSTAYIYLAIRRSNKPPTTGTQVYNAIARTGTGSAATVTGVGFSPDLVVIKNRSNPFSLGPHWQSRLIGRSWLQSSGIGAETALTASNDFLSFERDGYAFGSQNSEDANNGSYTYINYFFRRAPGFMGKILYGGAGANKTEVHNLGATPELWLTKRRNGVGSWVFGSILLAATEKIVMPSPNGKVTDATAWNSAYPTASNISLGTLADVNASGGTYVTYLFATLAGISKVGAYTGNGGTQIIGCGFSTGARFVMIIRTTAGVAQDIYIWDTARGIIAGNDPHLSLNTTTAEVMTDDSVDPDASGFIVNQNAATSINVLGASYIFLAIA